jgi:hypothetical protein
MRQESDAGDEVFDLMLANGQHFQTSSSKIGTDRKKFFTYRRPVQPWNADESSNVRS